MMEIKDGNDAWKWLDISTGQTMWNLKDPKELSQGLNGRSWNVQICYSVFLLVLHEMVRFTKKRYNKE